MTPQNTKIKVLLCNRHTLFREGIKALLLKKTGFEVIGEAATAKHALNLTRRLRPDVVLLDPTTPDLGASEVTRRIKAMDPHVEVLILSLDDDELLASGCLGAGATSYIRKYDEPLQLSRAISTACRKLHHAA